MLNFGRALDGTECLTGINRRGMCIGASCVVSIRGLLLITANASMIVREDNLVF